MGSNYRGITLLSLPSKVYSGVLERRARQIVEPWIQEEQFSFSPGRGTVDQVYTRSRVPEGTWKFAHRVPMCLVFKPWSAFLSVSWTHFQESLDSARAENRLAEKKFLCLNVHVQNT